MKTFLTFVIIAVILGVVIYLIARYLTVEKETGVPKPNKPLPAPLSHVKKYLKNTVTGRNEWVEDMQGIDIKLKEMSEMTFSELKQRVEKKGELTAVVRIRAYNPMFGIMAINVKEDAPKWVEPQEDEPTCRDFHHTFCNNTDEQNKRQFKILNNYWRVTIVPAFKGDTDMGSQFGPNHDGLGIVKIERLFNLI